MTRLLLADDEAIIRQCFGDMFSDAGYDVRTVASGEDAVAAFEDFKPDVVVLDVLMPKMNGFTACRQIREMNDVVPIIFLTSCADEVTEEQGVNIGADDYIFKTAPSSLILARIHRAVERAKGLASAAPAASGPSSNIRIGSATLNTEELQIIFQDGSREKLTPSELAIIRVLASNRNKFFSCREIFSRLGYSGEDVTLRSQISRLNTKLRPSGSAIESTRLRGYRLV